MQTNLLLLPHTPDEAAPAGSNLLRLPELPADALLKDWQVALAALPVPVAVIGVAKSPAMAWMAAARYCPDAEIYRWSDNGRVSLETGERAPEPNVGAPSTSNDVPPEPAKETPPPPPGVSASQIEQLQEYFKKGKPFKPQYKGPETRPPIWEWSEKELIREAYAKAKWGPQPDALKKLEQIEEIASSRSPELLQKVRTRISDGRRLFEAWTRIEEVALSSRGSGSSELEKILKEQPDLPPNARTVLENQLQRFESWQQTKISNAKAAKKNKANPQAAALLLAPLQFTGAHPNSLRHLSPARNWTVVVDETGAAFDPSVDDLDDENKQVGRFVAVVVPDTSKLPESPKGFHATDANDSQIDSLLRCFLAESAGILGLSVKDSSLGITRDWFCGIVTLLRWVLREIPFDRANATVPRVSVAIEQRGLYDQQTDLSAVARMLESEIDELEGRQGSIDLQLRIVPKDGHPLLAYADLVAYLWNKSTPASRERLQATRWLGHCLLNPEHDVLDRLYQSLNGDLPEPDDWYRIMSALPSEPAEGLLARSMARLGERLKTRQAQWQRYVALVQRNLAEKSWSLPAVAAALEWLDRYAPEETALPLLLQMEWRSAQLAVANHFGRVEHEIAEKCLQIGQRLRDEEPQRVCELDSRNAVYATNNFDFQLAGDMLAHWRDNAHAPAIVGRQRWGKVLSSLGQQAAFMGRFEEALALFDRALDAFSGLSDAKDAARQSRQTALYRLTVLCDLPACSPADYRSELERCLGSAKALASLAGAGDLHRYELALLWRSLVSRPEALADYRQLALKAKAQWQDGIAHPWPLINAYRGWLLHQAGEGSAAGYFKDAIADCFSEDSGPTVRWIGLVLQTLARAINLKDVPGPDTEVWQALRESLPLAPHGVLEQFQHQLEQGRAVEGLALLCQTLPFNFH